MSFQDKNIWITGASSGIGRATAIEFAKQGANLILSARSEAKLSEVKAECQKQGEKYQNKVWVYPLDLSERDTIKGIADQVIQDIGKIDVLFNNGGISQRALTNEAQIEVDRRIMEVNYFGTVALTKAVLPSMIQNGGGHLAATSSLVGHFGFPLRSAYAASKHALHGFFESLRFEGAKDNIRVTIVCPGRIKTDISKSALTKDGTQWGKSDEGQNKGMSVEQCAQQIVKAIQHNKKNIVIGSFLEKLLVRFKRHTPALFRWLVPKIKPT